MQRSFGTRLNPKCRLNTRDKIILENSKLRPQRHPRELLVQQFRSFKGEPPAVAGFLLYPDRPAKMETTSREAFCFRPIPQQDRGQKTLHNSHNGHNVDSSVAKTIGLSGVTMRETELDDGHSEASATDRSHQDPVDVRSQYQKDFPPPTSCRRRTPAFPQPDNIGINPAFRIDFNTIQRDTFLSWALGSPIIQHKPLER